MAGCINHHPEEVDNHGTSQAEIWEFPGKLLPRVCLMQFMACGRVGLLGMTRRCCFAAQPTDVTRTNPNHFHMCSAILHIDVPKYLYFQTIRGPTWPPADDCLCLCLVCEEDSRLQRLGIRWWLKIKAPPWMNGVCPTNLCLQVVQWELFSSIASPHAGW